MYETACQLASSYTKANIELVIHFAD